MESHNRIASATIKDYIRAAHVRVAGQCVSTPLGVESRPPSVRDARDDRLVVLVRQCFRSSIGPRGRELVIVHVAVKTDEYPSALGQCSQRVRHRRISL